MPLAFCEDDSHVNQVGVMTDAAELISLQAVASLTKVGAWTMHCATRTIVWNQQFRRIVEVDDEFFPSPAATRKFYQPEAFETLWTCVEAAQFAGEGWDLEVPMITATGRNIWARMTGYAVYDNGIVTHLAGALQDITIDVERRIELQDMAAQAQLALVNLSTYQTVLDHHALVATIGLDGRFAFVNDLFCSTSGYSREELIGQSQSILESDYHPQSLFRRMRHTLMRGQTWHHELRHGAKNRAIFWVDMTIVPVLDAHGRPERYVSVSYDITERKKTEAKLHEATSRIVGFFDVAHDAICVADMSGNFVSVNPAMEKILGYSTAELEKGGFVDLIHSDDIAASLKAVKQLKNGQSVDELINRYRRQDGQWRWMEWRATPRDGLVYCSARDISDRLAHERELLAAREIAEEATKAKSQFLANMSHEIRTPLNGVIGIASALSRLKMPDKQREMVDLIKGSGETLERLLNDILDLSKIEAGKLDLLIEDFNLVREIESASHLMAVRADEKGIGFKISYGHNARGLFKGDAVRLRQIVSNLASNAVKFTHKGGVNIHIDVEGDDVQNPHLVINVQDTGIGFDKAAGQRLFGRFEQADGTITRSFGGTGLGLSICRAISEMMGGSIHATSTLGEGSCFTATFPLPRAMNLLEFDTGNAELAGDDGAEPAFADDGEGPPLRLLVAEDHPINQKVVAMILEPYGIDITFANDGCEALQHFDTAQFDAILMDMQMPVMDGLTAIAAIREREQRLGLIRTPIAVLSANAMAEHIAMSLEAGSDTHIAKPVTPQSLSSGIEKLLALSSANADTIRNVASEATKVSA